MLFVITQEFGMSIRKVRMCLCAAIPLVLLGGIYSVFGFESNAANLCMFGLLGLQGLAVYVIDILGGFFSTEGPAWGRIA